MCLIYTFSCLLDSSCQNLHIIIIENLRLIGLSTQQKKNSREGVNITIASISKANVQMLALTSAPSRNSEIQNSLQYIEV